ncbi:transmembrane protein 192 isoform X3 [Austrofundulus limnaeus]|uniref:Transmembrane protein 192 isoform X3 n=1 Tax=Austrofundulus limnaeus TaxID=52670 RepID=A0A2I4C850_AUSLI|nr:PREDICTED: transmembrane protein 192 isoform X3 [Austrofundulus limnaeus]
MDSKGPSLRPQAGPSGDITQSTEEDSLVDGPLISADALHSAIRREFQPVPTTCPAGLLALLHVLYVVLSTCVALLCVLKFGQEEVCVNILDGVQVKVVQFNKERAAPDVSQEDLSHTNSVTASPAETGFRGPTNLEEVVEKQADLIEYLKQHNTLLSKRLLNLTAQH